MNCGLCMAYQRERNRCPGCRGSDVGKPVTRTACRIKTCPEFQQEGKKYCFQCHAFPCGNLKHLDRRYRTRYGMSMIENLESIKSHGIRQFIRDEQDKWTCRTCGAPICVHKGRCLVCEKKK
jgi:hypothetical protein